MPESKTERRAVQRKLTASTAADPAFKPSHKPVMSERSPHYTRLPTVASYVEPDLDSVTEEQMEAGHGSMDASTTVDRMSAPVYRSRETWVEARKNADVSNDVRVEEDGILGGKDCHGLNHSGYLGTESSGSEGMHSGGAGLAAGEAPTLGVGELSKLVSSLDQINATRQSEADRRMLESQNRTIELLGRSQAEAENRMVELFRQLREVDEEARATREKKAEKRELRIELLKGLGSYKEGTQLVGYLTKFERIMVDCGIKEDSWLERLTAHLPDRLCARIAQVRSDGGSYDEVKSELLLAVGENSVSYGFKLFEDRCETLKTLTAGQITEFIERLCRGVLQRGTSKEDCVVELALAYTRFVMPQDGRVFLRGRKIETMKNLMVAWEEWLAGRQPGNFYRPRVSGYGSGSGSGRSGSYQRNVSQGDGNGGSRQYGGYGYGSHGYGNSGYGGSIVCFSCGDKGHRAVACPKKVTNGDSGATDRPVKCYSCGKEGHKSPDCPNKKTAGSGTKPVPASKNSRLSAGKVVKDNVVYGSVNGKECRILIDSGAEVAMVPRSLVGFDVEDCGDIRVSGAVGEADTFCCTKVEFLIVGSVVTKLAMIVENDSDDMCIIPFCLGIVEECALFGKAIAEAKLRNEGDDYKLQVLTRAQANKEMQLDECEIELNEDDLWCTVEDDDAEESAEQVIEDVVEEVAPVVQEEAGPRQEESPVGMEVEVVHVDDVPADDDSVDDCVPREFGMLQECVDDGDAGSCVLIKDIGPMLCGNDGEKFKSATSADSSINTWRRLADREERGFSWKNGVVIKKMIVDWEERVEVVVVPKEFREAVLLLGHEKGGHLGGDKVLKMISKRFIWPGMAKEVLGHCRACPTCQKKSKFVPRKAPAVERPILSEPFEHVAIDLVGPLPKGKGGCRFLLTYDCLATRWPEAVPLRSITAKAVAEALWEIFSRTGIPEKILTDQGSQFVGKVMKSLCGLLGIERVRTSPYHPESNGVVERMHGTLKAILGKCINEEADWVGFVSLALFVLRQMPHADSGHSPFDLVYGFRVRTPLDVLYFCLVEGDEELKGSIMNGY